MMEGFLPTGKLKALPVQTIDISDGVILRRGSMEIKIEGRGAVEALRTVFTAARVGATSEQICENFTLSDRQAVEQLLRKLIERRLLVPLGSESERDDDGLESSLDIFYWNLGLKTSQVVKDLNRMRIIVIGVNCIARQLAAALYGAQVENFQVVDVPLMRNLRLFDGEGKLKSEQWGQASKIPLDFQDWMEKTSPADMDCVVATSDFRAHGALRDWNRFCVQHNLHYLPITLCDGVGYLGPFVLPGETACFECCYSRLISNTPQPDIRREIDNVGFAGQLFTGFHPSQASILGDLAAIELTKFYSGASSSSNSGYMLELDLLVPRLIKRRVLKVPRCPVCTPLNTQSSVNLKKRIFDPFPTVIK